MEKRVQEMLDKQDIYELLCRYCRGRDRIDMDLMLSCFHPEATGNLIGINNTFEGSIKEFHEIEIHNFRRFGGGQHYITNYLCEVTDDEAVSETYQFSYTWGVPGEPANVSFTVSNRYLDRLERRHGEWKILQRDFYRNFIRRDTSELIFPNDDNGWLRSTHDKADPAYRRAGGS